MLRILEADSARLEEILEGTYPIWGEGLSRPAYASWNRAQMGTTWGQANLRRLALLDGDTLLASAKRYDFRARIGGHVAPVVGIGAVFTPVQCRGRGHARALIDLMVRDGAARGCQYALLFSEIGPAFYEPLGFQAIPRTLVTIEVDRSHAGAPASFVRSGESADLPAISDISIRYAGLAGFALDRSADLIAFGIARRRLLAGLGPAGVREVEFFVSEEGHRPVAYVVIARGPGGVALEECGDLDPGGARIGAILQVLAAREPAEPTLRMTGWLPRDLRPPQVRVLSEQPASAVMMIRSLGDASSHQPELSPVVYWCTDVF